MDSIQGIIHSDRLGDRRPHGHGEPRPIPFRLISHVPRQGRIPVDPKHEPHPDHLCSPDRPRRCLRWPHFRFCLRSAEEETPQGLNRHCNRWSRSVGPRDAADSASCVERGRKGPEPLPAGGTRALTPRGAREICPYSYATREQCSSFELLLSRAGTSAKHCVLTLAAT